MRKAAGIILMISGLISLILFHSTLIGWVGQPATLETAYATAWVLPLDAFVSLGLIMGGGISALGKKHWWWALSGAIFCVFVGFFIFTDPASGQFWPPFEILMGTVALVFVCLRRREWQHPVATKG